MAELELLKAENANLKITIEVLLEKLSTLKAENAQLKKDVIEAARPRPKITPVNITMTDENVEKLVAGLKGHLHRNALRKKKVTVAIQLMLIHNQGAATSRQLLQATGLSRAGFYTQSLSVRKAGLMTHPAQDKFMLSEKSKEILNTVFGE
jgi:hypothetical protein